MRRVLAFLCATFVAAPAVAGEDCSRELMDKLARNEARLQQFYAEGSFRVTTHYQNLDPSSGAVKSQNDMVTRMFLKDGKPWEEIVKYVEAGKDTTASHAAQREKEMRDGKRKRADGIPFKSPFGTEEQLRYRCTDAGVDPADPSRLVISFAPISPTKDTQTGKAFIDAASGTIRRMEFEPAVKPNFVHRMDVTMEFAVPFPGGHALSRLVVDAEGGLFFVKRRVHVETLIDEYALPVPATAGPPASATAGPPAPSP